MEVKVLESTADWYKVAFKDAASNQQVIISISGAITKKWNLHTDQLMSTVNMLADEIFFNQDPGQPFKDEYMFTPVNCQPSLSATIDSMRQNSI